MAAFTRAWESADLDGLVGLLTDDVFMSMPPIPFEYEGRDVVARFCAGLFGAGRRFDLVPSRANGAAGVRRLPAGAGQHPARDGAVRAHAVGRQDLRADPVREQRAALVRPAAVAAGPRETAA